ncbi:hypothetical protein JCM3774_001943 [Rhodotorula dairenensis]
MAFHLDLGAPAPSSSHATSGSPSASRSMTPVPLLDSPSQDSTLPPAPGYGQASETYYSGYPTHPQHARRETAPPPQRGAAAGAPPPSSSMPSAAAAAHDDRQGAPPARTASGRAKGPPLRSTTMDDAYYVGPGEPSAVTRGKAPAAAGLYGAIGTAPPKPSGLYGHGNHSSPSLVESGSPELLPTSTLAGDATSLDGQSIRFTPFDIPDLPYMPAASAVDDLNIGLENMRFEPARPASTSTTAAASGRASVNPTPPPGRRYSPSSIGSIGQVGPDGAMEIRGYGGGDGTASVYSVESAFVYAAPPSAPPATQSTWERMHGRNDSAASSSSRVNAVAFEADYRRGSYGGGGGGGGGASSVDGYNEVDAMALRRASEGSYLAYDDGYASSASQARLSQPRMQQPQPGYGSGADYFVGNGGGGGAPGPSTSSSSTAYYPPGGEQAFYGSHSAPPPQQQQQRDRYSSGGPPPPGSVTFPQGSTFAPPPSFSPQVGQGGAANWGVAGGGGPYEFQHHHHHQQQVAAQNPYYAAATGQLGLEPASAAGPSSAGPYGGTLQRGVSSVSSIGPPLPPPSSSLSRSVSSLNVPGGGMRRKATSGSTNTVASSSSSSGPTITKASIDEYRQRVKADPDPEAQFNFAKYLIEAAKRLNSGANSDDRVAKKYRDALVAESLKLIKRLATQGSGLGKAAYADAQFFLANCLGTGSLGLQIDHEKAYNLYVQASKQNHSAATYRTAVCNELGAGTRKDYARAVLFYRKASALGDTAGMYKLGMILLHGHLGQQRNPKEGLAWLRRAASQADDENPHALHELGLLYEKPPLLNPAGGAGSLGAKVAAAQMQQHAAQSGQQPPPPIIPTLVPFDPAQAREFFTQAAQLGYPPSQYKLGLCYEFGALTCPVDPRRSIAWYTRAAERNEPNAELALSGWYLTGSEGVLKQSDSEAYLWARRAANKGLPKAEYAVGYYAEVGIGVKADLEEAKRWYMRAAAQGNKRAMQRLTELKKLGADKRAAGGKKRPTRKDAETECTVM